MTPQVSERARSRSNRSSHAAQAFDVWKKVPESRRPIFLAAFLRAQPEDSSDKARNGDKEARADLIGRPLEHLSLIHI